MPGPEGQAGQPNAHTAGSGACEENGVHAAGPTKGFPAGEACSSCRSKVLRQILLATPAVIPPPSAISGQPAKVRDGQPAKVQEEPAPRHRAE